MNKREKKGGSGRREMNQIQRNSFVFAKIKRERKKVEKEFTSRESLSCLVEWLDRATQLSFWFELLGLSSLPV